MREGNGSIGSTVDGFAHPSNKGLKMGFGLRRTSNFNFHMDRMCESTKSSALSIFRVEVVDRFGSLRNSRSRSSAQSLHWRRVLCEVSLTISLILVPGSLERRLRPRPRPWRCQGLEKEPELLPFESLGSVLPGFGLLESESVRSGQGCDRFLRRPCGFVRILCKFRRSWLS